MDTTLKLQVLQCFYKLISYEGSSSAMQAICEDLIQKNIGYFSGLIPHIFQCLSKSLQYVAYLS